nr:MAG TPA: hypothetical protein [Caudoviricetes sp.]
MSKLHILKEEKLSKRDVIYSVIFSRKFFHSFKYFFFRKISFN